MHIIKNVKYSISLSADEYNAILYALDSTKDRSDILELAIQDMKDYKVYDRYGDCDE